MQNKRRMLTLIAAAVFSASGFAVAAEGEQATKPAPNRPGMPQMPMDHGMMGEGMMGGGMMGMMNMMHACDRMGGAMPPAMPRGNEKIEFQMRAEMMQKMGEIALKYAEKIQVEKRSAR